MRLATLALLLATTTPVLADPPKCEVRDDRSYRGTLMAIEGVALGLVAAAYATDGALAIVALPVYWLASPQLHVAHGRCGRGGASLAARVALPSLGATIAKHTDERYLAVGLGIGAVLASVLDVVVISSLGRAAPVVAPAPGGATIGLATSF